MRTRSTEVDFRAQGSGLKAQGSSFNRGVNGSLDQSDVGERDDGARVGCLSWRGGAEWNEPDHVLRAHVAHAGSVPRRTRRRGQRRARSSERVLFRRRQRRRVEDDRRRTRLGARVRRPAGGVDRRAGRGAIRAEHRLRRQRRIDAARLDGLRQRRLQVDRCRARRGRTSASTNTQHIGKIAVDPREPDVRVRRGDRPSVRGQARSAACSARATAERPGRKCYSRTTTSAPWMS